jgi:hypothetical protein
VATSEFGTVKAISPGRMEIAKDDGNTVTLNPTKYDKWGLGYSGTGYKGQGKTQVKTAAVYDNPYAWDSRAAYVIGTRHRDEYQLFVPRELAPDLATLSGQIMRQRVDRGSSLRFEAVAGRRPGQGLDAEDARQKLGKALDHGREVLTAAKARAAIEAERQRRVEKLNQGHRLDRGPSLGR